MQVRQHSRARPGSRSRSVEACRLADQLRDWLAVADSERTGAAAPLVVERPEGSALAIHLLRPPGPAAGSPGEEAVGEMLSIETLRALGLTRREAEVMQILAR